MEFSVSKAESAHQRLDHFLQACLPDLSRTRIQSLIKDGHIRLNESAAKPNAALKLGDRITVAIPEATTVATLPQDIPLEILFEDEHLIVVNKPAGLVVHPAAGNPDGTLVNALLHHCKNLSGIGGELRPGIVHRLDKETSGCLVAAKHDLAHTRLTQAFSERHITKIYLAAVNGIPATESGRIENRIGRHPVDRKRMTILTNPSTSKEAITEWRRSAIHQGCALIECRLLTGRTHQIRVHLRECLKTPILGDTIYAQPQRQILPVSRLMLHAWKLGFTHPITERMMDFESTIPEEYLPWIKCGTPQLEKRQSSR
ncbi:MAG: RluA family pseudouridine synthase [Verrucomicrobia bacterium]|nr:RluA family pseudouridine synthase [Verrucomicrobiota bacterium]